MTTSLSGDGRMLRMHTPKRRLEPEPVTEAKIAVADASGWTEVAKAVASGMTALGAGMIAVGLALVARIQQGENAVTDPSNLLTPAVAVLILALMAWFGVAASSLVVVGKQRALIRAEAGVPTPDEERMYAIHLIAQARIYADVRESQTDYGAPG